MLLTIAPQSNTSEDSTTTITYNCYFGNSWEEFGVSQVDGFLSALGFSTPQEVASFCASVDVFETFSTEGWMRQYVNDNDRQIIARFGKAQHNFKLIQLDLIPAENYKLKTNPSYADFFQVLFTWMTGANTVEGRNKFIKYWENPAGFPSSKVRNPSTAKTDSAPCLISFKAAVDAFLQGIRAPKPKAEMESALVNAAHSFRLKGLSWFLHRSNWGYISGTGATASIAAGKFASLGVGSGGFAVFENGNPQKMYPLMTAGGNAGIGAGVALPVNVTVDPADLPSKGTVFHGLSGNVTGIHSFIGAFVAISGGVAATIFNQTSSLMFIAPSTTLVPVMGSNNQASIFLSVVPFSTAILALDGHGVEVGFGISAQLSCGFVGPQPQKK